MKTPFRETSILIPQNIDLGKWAVVACDQYSSQPEYWDRVLETVTDQPSALNIILPEAWLNTPKAAEHQAQINDTMMQYLDSDLFAEYPDSYVYVERTLANGSIRRGLVGAVDLEQYDFSVNDSSAIRATEATIIERIPPRVQIRENASMEIPHVLLLADDDQDMLLSGLEAAKHTFPLLYDFDLMEQGGHIMGWLVNEEAKDDFNARLEAYQGTISDKYPGMNESTLTFAVGDGNHSLATAKTIWETIKPSLTPEEREHHPARFAMAELENIHDASQVFEPIHRIVKNTDPDTILDQLKPYTTEDEGFEVTVVVNGQEFNIYLDPAQGELPVAVLQKALDGILKKVPGDIDYIHEDEIVRQLASQDKSIGFLLPGIDKSSLFRGVIADGSLPRKTFSMGHAHEKRFYLEGRKIK